MSVVRNVVTRERVSMKECGSAPARQVKETRYQCDTEIIH